jgi:hypothetical protein
LGQLCLAFIEPPKALCLKRKGRSDVQAIKSADTEPRPVFARQVHADVKGQLRKLYFQPQSSGAISFKFAVYLLRLHSPHLALEDVITVWK